MDNGYKQFKRWLKIFFCSGVKSRRIVTNLLNLCLSKFSYLLTYLLT